MKINNLTGLPLTNRSTGKSTGGLLLAIGYAIANPDIYVVYSDHSGVATRGIGIAQGSLHAANSIIGSLKLRHMTLEVTSYAGLRGLKYAGFGGQPSTTSGYHLLIKFNLTREVRDEVKQVAQNCPSCGSYGGHSEWLCKFRSTGKVPVL